ncbi:ABC transporter substrate-binding protein [Corynebacterium auris]|uniref:ABC transporter substrate-binding protein n=1 Tax=Corynebacterium auris TaxID=44750 RepID=UPI0025B328A7|nr:iron-siderophore ABC transporter substrate-binding protein [Corynebacterium auris]WJY68459.1 putative siderophore-binding lipoprotein YfiY precursor [Corynebacterium auris]
MSTSRRHFLKFATLITAGALGLAGCSSTEGASASSPSGGSSATREVKDVNDKSVTVPEDPQRVVALSEPTVDGLLALGVTPVGIVAGRGQSGAPAYLQDKAGSIDVMGSVGQPNFEAIGAANPDLILIDGTSVNNNPPVIEALEHIAPVVYTGYAGGDWKRNFTLVADAVNKKSEGEKIISDYEKKADGLAGKLDKYSGSTFSIVRWEGSSPSLILKEQPAGRALTDVGLKRPASQDREGPGHSVPVSSENMADIDADFMFFGTLGGSSVNNKNAGGQTGVDASRAAVSSAEQIAGFTNLTAYREKHIIPVDGTVWMSTGGPLLMNRILDDIQSTLL